MLASLRKDQGCCVCGGITSMLGSHQLITGNLRLSKLGHHHHPHYRHRHHHSLNNMQNVGVQVIDGGYFVYKCQMRSATLTGCLI